MINLSVHPLSIPPLMMAAVVFYVGLSHVLLCRRRDDKVLDLAFAVTCFGMGLYDLFCAGLYSASTTAEGAVFQQAQITTIALTSIFFVWFIAEYTELISRAICATFVGYFAIAAAVNALGGPLVLHLNAPAIKEIHLPFIGPITYYEVTAGFLMNLQSVIGMVALGVLLLAAYRYWRRTPVRRSRRLLQALSIFAIGAANDTAVGSGLHETVYLMEYCFLAMVLAMTSSLTREAAATESTKELLVTMQRRFHVIFRSVSVGIGMTDCAGVLFEANAALAAMFGRRAGTVVGTALFDHLHPDDARSVRDSMEDLLSGDVPAYRDEVRYIQPDGSEFWGDVSAGVMRDQSGEIQAISWIVIGITERRRAVASLTRVNVELEDRIADRTTELTETNRRLSRILSEVEESEHAAQLIQFSLLPKPVAELRGLRFEHFLLPSSVMSGDFLDYFEVGDTHVVFYMADVSGHGVPSSFVTVLLKSFMRSLREQHASSADDTILSPQRVLEQLNDHLRSQNTGKHVTILYGVVNTESNELRLATGGHFPHPVLSHGGSSDVLTLKGAAVGLFEKAPFNCLAMELPDNCWVGLFSDGVLEILPQQHLQEKQAYLASLMEGAPASAEELAGRIGVRQGMAPPDDVTILLMRGRTSDA